MMEQHFYGFIVIALIVGFALGWLTASFERYRRDRRHMIAVSTLSERRKREARRGMRLNSKP